MKKIFDWQFYFAALLIALSAVFYSLHYWLFKDLHHIFLYLVGDIAFLFLDVLIVTLILHRLLGYREKQSVLRKLNMVIGTFFIEVGTELIKKLSAVNAARSDAVQVFAGLGRWTDKEFASARQVAGGLDFQIAVEPEDLKGLRVFLLEKRAFLLSLLENPNLLEHEAFTDLLWAVFHLADELMHRNDVGRLTEPDRRHLGGDMKRVFQHLVVQWLEYLGHLRKDYPYLHSLAIRTNPFDPKASVEVAV